MDPLLVFSPVFLLVLFFCAWKDFKNRKIPDVYTAALYFILLVFGFFKIVPELAFSCIGLGFSGIFCFVVADDLIGRLFKEKRSDYIFSWGDILIFPPVFAFTCTLLGQIGVSVAAISLFLPAVLSFALKREVPVAPSLFLGSLGAVIFQTVLVLFSCLLHQSFR